MRSVLMSEMREWQHLSVSQTPVSIRAHRRQGFAGRDPDEAHRGATPLELLYGQCRPNARRRARWSRAELERLGLRRYGRALPSFPSLDVVPVRDCCGAELLGQTSVVGAEAVNGRDGSALATVAQLRSAPVHVSSVARSPGSRARVRAWGSK